MCGKCSSQATIDRISFSSPTQTILSIHTSAIALAPPLENANQVAVDQVANSEHTTSGASVLTAPDRLARVAGVDGHDAAKEAVAADGVAVAVVGAGALGGAVAAAAAAARVKDVVGLLGGGEGCSGHGEGQDGKEVGELHFGGCSWGVA